MVAKQPTISCTPAHNFQKELELLYARRAAIDAVIRSLTDYDHFRAKRLETRKLKTA
jgi:hypothetical protein